MPPEPFVRPLPTSKIQPQNTALLIIDMERDFVDEGAVQETPGGRALVPTINALSAWARSHGVPVIFTFEMHRTNGDDYGIELEYDPVHCLEGTPGCTLAAGLETRASVEASPESEDRKCRPSHSFVPCLPRRSSPRTLRC